MLLESRDRIGGNIQSLDVDLDGHQFAVDLGAQFFHPGPYPVYTALLESLGLFPPTLAPTSPSAAFLASITIEKPGEPKPRVVSPILTVPYEAWSLPGLIALFTPFTAAKAREEQNESWSLTLDDWLQTLAVSPEHREGIILPWAASLFSGDIDQARGMSARAAMLFAAKALPDNPAVVPVVYYALRNGLIEPMHQMLHQCSTSTWKLTRRSPASLAGAAAVSRALCGRPELRRGRCGVRGSGPGTLQLLEGVPDRRPSSQRSAASNFTTPVSRCTPTRSTRPRIRCTGRS